MIFQKIRCLVVTSNLVKLKSISSWPKIRAKTTKNHFRFHFHFKWFPALENRRERERERERKSKKIADVGARRSHRSKTIAPLRSFKPTLVEPSHRSSRSSRHFRPMREEWDRESKEIVAPRTHSHRRVAPRTREPVTDSFSFSFSFEIFVIKFVCDFDFLLSLFDLWFCCCCCGGVGGGVLVVFLLCGGGFCGGWWWKIAFSKCYQTHEIIF